MKQSYEAGVHVGSARNDDAKNLIDRLIHVFEADDLTGKVEINFFRGKIGVINRTESEKFKND